MFNTPIPERVVVIRSLYNRLAPGQEIKVVAMLLDQESLDFFLSGINSGYTHGYRIPGARPDAFHPNAPRGQASRSQLQQILTIWEAAK
jgi:hypothetical protein